MMKGFKSQLSVTISRMQMIKIFQKYYNEKIDDDNSDMIPKLYEFINLYRKECSNK